MYIYKRSGGGGLDVRAFRPAGRSAGIKNDRSFPFTRARLPIRTLSIVGTRVAKASELGRTRIIGPLYTFEHVYNTCITYTARRADVRLSQPHSSTTQNIISTGITNVNFDSTLKTSKNAV